MSGFLFIFLWLPQWAHAAGPVPCTQNVVGPCTATEKQKNEILKSVTAGLYPKGAHILPTI
jgi:hypothetical protein